MTNAPSPARIVDVEVPVLIVGGSLVGLANAMFLAHHGVETLSVEKHEGTAIHPRAGYFHLRTIELMRVAGIESRVRAAALQLYEPDGGLNAVETLAGKEIASYIPNINADVADVSPARRLFMPQQVLEPILLERARELGARFEYATELVRLEQDADGVTATVRDIHTLVERTIRAQYLVACDGNRSPIREDLGIAMRGHGLLSRSVTIYFRADCSHALRGRNLGVIYVHNPQLRGFFRLEKTGLGGFLVVFTVGDINEPGARYVADIATDELAVQMVREAVGEPDLEVHVEDVDKWRAVADVADTFQAGRVFLAGDAAHTMPPTGGFGGNTGIQDAHNLAWKLALVIEGPGRSRAARELRRRAPARRRAGRRAGLQPLRAAVRPRPRPGGRARGHPRHARRVQPLPVAGRRARRRRRRRRRPGHQPPPVLRPSRHPGAPRRAGAGRRGHLHPRPVRGRLRAAGRS